MREEAQAAAETFQSRHSGLAVGPARLLAPKSAKPNSRDETAQFASRRARTYHRPCQSSVLLSRRY